ncbi:5-oxoprolinase subunit PxpA [Candidatus Pantoea multigeneris]|uniref:LamB/YcsF family protein n=1 Tax=Candidatus Pantoea multigeneris TaxID=2608357 RepID=A0ABX0REP1_9GAMM|nr:5-oxoprolinase subunit PxpA [Pantoea multigeneris]NIF23826.1 LamB/YcsF family protein [Pantoea multigeneris]
MKIDVNSDMGEGFGVYQLCDDDAMMNIVSSANIACGFHAGDPAIMTNMVRLAKARGVGIGGHPGFPDRQGFGRREIPFSDDEICQLVAYQVGALMGIAAAEGGRVAHVSFHAALGNVINRDEALALRVMSCLARLDRSFIIFCQSDTIIERAAIAAGLRSLTLFLADRAYQANGQLVPRGKPGAVINDEATLRARVRQFLQTSSVTTYEGENLPLRARSILVHSDTPGSVELATIIRSEIEASGNSVAPASDVLAQ